jgi:GNAT superfamily N-acetyltransferase
MLFADSALARRIERERGRGHKLYATSFDRCYPQVGTTVETIADGHAIFVGQDSPISRAVDVGIDGPVSSADLDRLEAFYFDRGMACRIDLTPFSDPSLVALLGARGYQVAWFLNLLIRPDYAADEALPPSPEVTVEQVAPTDIPLWASLVSRGFGGTGSLEEPNIALGTGNREGVTCFMARVGGEPAGASAMSVGEGIAGFMSTSVLPQFRGRGAQTAMLRARLAAAQAAGCDLVEVQTSPGSNSQRNVMRFGFQVAYTRMVMAREKA